MGTNTDATVRVGTWPGRPWVRVAHGLHRSAECDDLDAWQATLPASAAFSHLTAAALHGWWLPELPPGLPVLVDQHRSDPRSRRSGIRVTRTSHPVPTCRVRGLRVATPEHTLLACARDLGLLDLVVLVDSALRAGRTPADIASVAVGHERGSPRLRRALTLADARSESPWETALRLLHVCVGAQVEPQHVVRTRDGGFVARGDLWLVGTRTLHEYDGAVHRTADAQAKDLRRDRALTATGWTRRGYVADDLRRTPVAVLRDIDEALGRAHRPERVQPWLTLLRESGLTPAGRTRLARRIAP